MNINSSCFFTGHRRISTAATPIIQAHLNSIVKKYFISGITHFISGGALGFDMLCADTVINLIDSGEHDGLTLSMHLPCRNHTARWTNLQKLHLDRILLKADNIMYATDGNYTPECMRLRNYMMVNNAMYGIAFCQNKHSGTYQTLQYAKKNNRNIINIANMIIFP